MLTFQSPEVGRRDSKRTVVEEIADLLDGLTCVSSQLGSAVPKNGDTRERQSSGFKVLSEVRIKRA